MAGDSWRSFGGSSGEPDSSGVHQRNIDSAAGGSPTIIDDDVITQAVKAAREGAEAERKLIKTIKVGAGITTIVLFPFLITWQGFVVERLWEWFLVSNGVFNIGLLEAIGILIMARVFTMRLDSKDWDIGYAKSANDAVSTYIQKITFAVGLPAWALLFGFIAHVLT